MHSLNRLILCGILLIASCQKKQVASSWADQELSQIALNQKDAEQILSQQKRVEWLLNSHALSSTSQQIRGYHTLAQLYCLLPETAPLADEAIGQAIHLSEQQLKDLFETRNRYDTKTFAIHQLKKSIRSLKLQRAEINMQLHRWEEALHWLESYTKNDEEIPSRIQRLEERQREIAPFTSIVSTEGRSVYQLEWERVETELTELKKVLEYKNNVRQRGHDANDSSL